MPLANILTGGDEKLANDFTGYFLNAVISSGAVPSNVRKLYSDAGLDREQAYTQVLQLYENDELDLDSTEAMLASIDSTFGVVNPNQGVGGQEEFGLR